MSTYVGATEAIYDLHQGMRAVFDRLEREGKKAFNEAVDTDLRAMANAFKRDLVTGVEQNRYNLRPLSKPWLATKKKHGLDSRILIAFGEMLRQVRVREMPRSGRERGFVIEPTKVRVKKYRFQKRGANLTYEELWAINEKTRPAWAATAQRALARQDQISRDFERSVARRTQARVNKVLDTSSHRRIIEALGGQYASGSPT